MQLEARKYFHDVQEACNLLGQFIAGRSFTDYVGDGMLRAAVEREFEIIGEALAQLARLDEELVSRISEHRRIIAFRNILIHGYAEVDDLLVWDILQTKLQALRQEVTALLEEA